MRLEIGVVKDKLFEFGELTFDSVQPRGIGRRPDEHDVVAFCPSADLFPTMWRDVVQDDENAFSQGVMGSHALECPQTIGPAFAFADIAPQDVLMHIVEGQQVACPVRSPIGGRESVGFGLHCPDATVHRA